MELIDRYLQAVKWMLPRKQQDDVVRELNDEILSRVEEKEDALDRPLTEDEQVALLKQMDDFRCARHRAGQVRLLRQVGPAHAPQAEQNQTAALHDRVGGRAYVELDLRCVVAGWAQAPVLDLRARL